ncbi:MAG TPA: DNA starvation/stationary phase protection protein [Flavobacteriaceae bacterium]|nr:DNA starvation/stationary phase protection protein [Flavobacteriaceae bacterium]
MNYLNLDEKKIKAVVGELNVLLADYHLYYQKLRNFHWNIIGKSFFDLHEKFEELYEDAKTKIDEIAERILTLRHQPISNYSDYLKNSNLKEASSDIPDVKMVQLLLKDHGTILKEMRKVINTAEKAGDEGTIDLIGAYIRELEKVSWMLETWVMKTSEHHIKS